jgi:hypothetical protein
MNIREQIIQAFETCPEEKPDYCATRSNGDCFQCVKQQVVALFPVEESEPVQPASTLLTDEEICKVCMEDFQRVWNRPKPRPCENTANACTVARLLRRIAQAQMVEDAKALRGKRVWLKFGTQLIGSDIVFFTCSPEEYEDLKKLSEGN